MAKTETGRRAYFFGAAVQFKKTVQGSAGAQALRHDGEGKKRLRLFEQHPGIADIADAFLSSFSRQRCNRRRTPGGLDTGSGSNRAGS